uniref:Putative Methyltransferase FkbM family n=1 Tax=Rubrivivax gelatinosus S1 TaxID=1138313 RepID=L8B9W8_RUBGE|nr:putative Methyltransferase FkbM family [Rubrivivax gelatinosus S1]
MGPRLGWLKQAGVEVGTVLDVGVQAGTEFLIQCFPDRPHVLFEPVEPYFEGIRQRYRNVEHRLVEVALSDAPGTVWLNCESRDGSGLITHSGLAPTQATKAERPDLVISKPVKRMTLDEALADQTDARPYLLKVDVDGHESQILRGAQRTLAHASIAIVEATTTTLLERAGILADAGFMLLDIVDLCYYHEVLSQVDLIFVHRDWVARCPDLRPWMTKTFAWSAWAPLAHHDALVAASQQAR